METPVQPSKNGLFGFISSLKRHALCGLILSLACLPIISQAATLTFDVWVGTNSTDWNDALNWSAGVPGAVNAVINTNSPNICTVTVTPPAFPLDVIIGDGAGQVGRLDQTGGDLQTGDTNTSGNWFFVGRSGGTGTYNLTGTGNLTVGKLWVGGANYYDNGTGTVNIDTTGSIVANSTDPTGAGAYAPIIMANAWNGGTANATINLINGTIQANGDLWVGRSGTATFNQSGGIVNVQGYFVVGREPYAAGGYTNGNGTYNLWGGTVNASTSNGFPVLASFTNAQGTLNVSGGTFNAANKSEFRVGEGGTGTLNISGGLVVVSNTLVMGLNAGSIGTNNLNGGTLMVGTVSGGAGTSIFNFNGGILKPTASTTTFMQGLTAAYVQGGGVRIDTAGHDITIGQYLQDAGGGLTKSGSGTLTLGGGYGYSGTTTVSGGTLTIPPGVGLTPPIPGDVVVSNATLKVTGHGSPMPAANLTLDNNSVLTADFGSVDSLPTVPAINASGSLTTGTNVTINVNLSGPGVVPGLVPLITVAGAVPPGQGVFVLGSLPPGIQGVLTNSTPTELDLLITSAPQNLSLICSPNKTVECNSGWHFDPPTVVGACCTNPTVWFLGSSVLSTNPCQTVWEARWQASDCCSNYSEVCTQFVTVVDTTPPQLFCSNLTNDCTQPGGARVYFNVQATDNCDPNPTVTYYPPSGTLFQPGNTVVTATATDACGNTNACNFTVTVLGNCPTNCVQIFCPPTNVVAYACGTNGAYVPFVVQATNYCDPTNLTVVCNPEPNTWFGLGDTPVYCWVYGSGYTDYCSFMVTVFSNCPPECLSLTCSTDIVRTCTGFSGTVVMWTNQALNLCNPGYVTNWCVPPSGTAFPIGTNPVTCYAKNTLSGEVISCGFNVVITVPPPILSWTFPPGGTNVVGYRLRWTEVGQPFTPVWNTNLDRGWLPYVGPLTYAPLPTGMTVREAVPPGVGLLQPPDATVGNQVFFRLTSDPAVPFDFSAFAEGGYASIFLPMTNSPFTPPDGILITPDGNNPLVVSNVGGMKLVMLDTNWVTIRMPIHHPTLANPFGGTMNVHQLELRFVSDQVMTVEAEGYDVNSNAVNPYIMSRTNQDVMPLSDVELFLASDYPWGYVKIRARYPGSTGGLGGGSMDPGTSGGSGNTVVPLPGHPSPGCQSMDSYPLGRVPNPWITPDWIITSSNVTAGLETNTFIEDTPYGHGYHVEHSAEISFTNSTCCPATDLLLDHGTNAAIVAAYDSSGNLLAEDSVNTTDDNPVIVSFPLALEPTCRLVVTSPDGPIRILAICCKGFLELDPFH